MQTSLRPKELSDAASSSRALVPCNARPESALRILAVAPNDWAGPWMNRQQLLSRLGRMHRILYSTGPLDVWSRHQRRWKRAPWRSTFAECDNVLVDRPGKLDARWRRLAMTDNLALRRAARRWSAALAGQGNLVLHVFHPGFAPLLEHVPWNRLVYHAYDVYSKMPDWTQESERAEVQLVQRADLAIGSSRGITEHLTTLGARNSLVLPNGVDYERFSTPGRAPDDIDVLPHPRIGYVGNINRKVNLPLLDAIAASRPDWQIVIIGGIGRLDDLTESALASLRRRSNVHLLGAKTRELLPDYMSALDVGTICYRVDADVWTEEIYPLKLNEYLAVGLPIVSADIPSVREFTSVVKVVREDQAAWLSAIEHAIVTRETPTDIRARRAVARTNSWDNRVAVLDDALRDLD